MPYTQELKNKINTLFENASDDCTSVGYGFKEKNGVLTKEKSIIFTFKKKKPLSELTQDEIIPASIPVGDEIIVTDVREGINTHINFEACPADFYGWSDNIELNPNEEIPPTNRNKIRPLKGGLKIRNQSEPFYGTMGFIAIDNETNSLVGVTNNHVMTRIMFRADEENRGLYNNYNVNMGQPSDNYDERVGKTKRYYPVVGGNVGNNFIDAALFSVTEDHIDFNESYKYEGLSFEDPAVFATTEEIDTLIDNDWNFYSTGARTGAKGEGSTKLKFLSYSNVTVLGELNDNTAKIIKYLDCITFIASANTTTQGYACYYPINGGDSGSALLAEINGVLKIIGLVFASNSLGFVDGYVRLGIACRIDHVKEILDISPFTGQTNVNFTNTIGPMVISVNGFSSLTATTIDGVKYHQLGTYIPQ